jgi:hypothetical protein
MNLEYTLSSVDEDHYNRISTAIQGPLTKWCRLTATCLTTNCYIKVLREDDYIIINGTKYEIENDHTNMRIISFVTYMKAKTGLNWETDACQRISITGETELIINDWSYNVGLIMGLYNSTPPIQSIDSTIKIKSVGFTLSTPVLYLMSNLGFNSYKNTQNNFTSNRILMRLNNSYTSEQPIICTNGDFQTIVNSSDLSDIRFQLVDANFHEVELLSPMYICVSLEPVDDVEFGELMWQQKE